MGNDSGIGSSQFTSIYFNPRSRVGNDPAIADTAFPPKISIHVPAWGTTNLATGLNNAATISIHVPAWGTTVSYPNSSLCFLYFNPRSRVGNDYHHPFQINSSSLFQSTFPRGERQSHINDMEVIYYISIHVPAWGTTISP